MPVFTARDAADLLEPHFAGAANERLVTAFFDDEGRLLALEAREEERGEVGLPFRAIVARALAENAAGVVIAHNHPSGDPAPSSADQRLTRRLAITLDAVGVTLHDHLILANGEWESFRRLGLL